MRHAWQQANLKLSARNEQKKVITIKSKYEKTNCSNQYDT
jgi:hypothetical protein